MDYPEYDSREPSKRVTMDNSSFELETRYCHKVKISLTLVKELASMEASIDDLATVLWFYRAVKNTETHKWVKVSELENTDLTGWSLWHYKEDYDFSDWEHISLPLSIKRNKNGCLVLEEILDKDYPTDFIEENEDVLLVKPYTKEYSQELAMGIELQKQQVMLNNR